MTSSIVAVFMIVVLVGAVYALGRAHRPRTPWQDGYQQGVADTTKAMFKSAVRATTFARNSAQGRFRLPFAGPRVRVSGTASVNNVIPLKDEPTQLVVNPLQKPPRHAAADDLDEETTVRLRLLLPGADTEAAPAPQPETEAAA